VDHFIDFKGCRRHQLTGRDEVISMKEFMDEHIELLQQLPQYTSPNQL
jgi:hypothetical protein